jgi:hypothetical protein
VLIKDAKPLRAWNYRVSPFIQRLIDKEDDNILRLGAIERDESEWNLLTSWCRFVIDFRGVNAKSKRMCYPFPNISHILDNLDNAKYLSSLDIPSACWEIPLEENSRPLTAFSIAGRGQYAAGTSLVYGLFTLDLKPYVNSTIWVSSEPSPADQDAELASSVRSGFSP